MCLHYTAVKKNTYNICLYITVSLFFSFLKIKFDTRHNFKPFDILAQKKKNIFVS